jgi:hypothetical protein
VPTTLLTAIFALALLPAQLAPAQYPYRVIYPEQRQIEYRDPSQFPAIPLPPTSPPPTVSSPPTGDTRYFPLDDAIRTALGVSVIRVLAWAQFPAAGRSTTRHRQHRDRSAARPFDPAVFVATIGIILIFLLARRLSSYRLDVGVAKQNPLGPVRLGVNVTGGDSV